MVLQRDHPNPIWGWDIPNTEVTVSFAGKDYPATTDAKGRWTTTLGPLAANSQPQSITITGSSEVRIHDVLIGEVWICSGQSNMQWTLRFDWHGAVDALASDNSQLRSIRLPNRGSQELKDDFEGEWKVSAPETSPHFSAIGYHFARYLQRILKIPVGLIDNSWGGSSAEAWVLRDALKENPVMADILKTAEEEEARMRSPEAYESHKQAMIAWEENNRKLEAKGEPIRRWPPQSPEKWMHGNKRVSSAYGGKLHPIIGYGIKGVIWYQGEANAGRAYQYDELFPFLIQQWRADWKQGSFPFYWAQLADFKQEWREPQESHWAELREAQSKTLALPNTGQAITIDLGEGNDIHPRKKHDVAARLVRWALARDYGYDIPHRSPEYHSINFHAGKALIQFDCFGGKLRTVDTDTVEGFAICDKDQVWLWANAKIVDDNLVEVWNDEVPNPIAVRYAWADNPICNLYSDAGLPVTPFRTDDFPLSSESE